MIDKTKKINYNNIIDRCNQLEKRLDTLILHLDTILKEVNLNFKGNIKCQNLVNSQK